MKWLGSLRVKSVQSARDVLDIDLPVHDCSRCRFDVISLAIRHGPALVCVAGLEIGVAGLGAAEQTAQMLARAFYDDPVFGWMLPAGGSRHRRLCRFFVTELRHESLRHGVVEVACVDGRVTGAAVWYPPGHTWSGTEVSALPGYLRAFGRRLVVVSKFQ